LTEAPPRQRISKFSDRIFWQGLRCDKRVGNYLGKKKNIT